MSNFIEKQKGENMKKKILVASGNPGKLKEVAEVFSDFEIVSLKQMEKQLGKELVVEENKDTFSKNALQKATMLSEQVGDEYIVFADDSGISLNGLDGFPGVSTRRWMPGTDHDRNLALIKKIEGNSNRICRYTTAIAVCDGRLKIADEYSLVGEVASAPRGDNGFGFDEIFQLENGKTLAEITTSQKLAVSPRKKALLKIKEYLV